jgi:hypothetical protein
MRWIASWMMSGLVGLVVALGAPDQELHASSSEAMRGAGHAPAVADTTPSRADSARLRVLERIRERTPVPEPEPAAPDTVGDPDERTLAPVPPNQARAQPPARTALPSGSDSTMQALADLPGYRMAVYQGERADFEARDRRLVLWGTPEARATFSGQGNRVEADSSIVYDDLTGRIRTTGPSLFTPDRGDPMESRALIYDLQEQRGSALGARTTYTEGANWIVEGDLDSVEDGRLFGSRTRFTSCDLDPPHSHFQAQELKLVADQVLVARGVRMYVEDVPVLWLPFLAQNLGSGRASGVLTPRFSMNDVVRTSSGYNRRISNVGYYWAMSDYSDMTVAMDWFSNNYTALSAGLRYRWRQQFLRGNADVKHYWRDTGRRELALNTRHDWDISERTRANISARFVTSSDFVRENSFDPREVTQNIRSDAGFSHRFDWGNLSVSANRNQFLSEERTDMTLPSVNLSLATRTLFAAPPASASWYNNLSLGGGMRFSRDLHDRPFQEDTVFVLNRADELRTRASMNASMGLGDASLSGRVEFSETVFSDVPGRFFPGGNAGGDPNGDPLAVGRMGGFTTGDGLPPALDPFLQSELMEDPAFRDDLAQATVSWGSSLGYRVNLIGSTTLTPSVGLSGELRRTDTIPVASSFVTGPVRVTAGARLQTDMYGFYPGFRDFEAIRHKITPSASFDYSPAVTPTNLQQDVFGARTAHPRKVLTFGFNQTFEARLPEREEEPEAEPEEEEVEELEEMDELIPPVLQEELEEPEMDVDRPPARTVRDEGEGPRRMPRARVVNLLALNTSSVTYDIVQADSTGEFLRGFQTTRISNTVRSDYLRGLDLSFEHDLFDDPPLGGSNGEQVASRQFAPHLSRLSLGFRVDHRSGIVRAVRGLLGMDREPDEDDPDAPDEQVLEATEDDEGIPTPGGDDANRIMPGGGPGAMGRRMSDGWDARISYSLRRPRESAAGTMAGTRAQMLQWTLGFAPTENWDASWNSSYDLEAGRFNDHMVQLRRDLHEWEATFSFRQTATGNWSFQFEVALRANQDLRFDYEQRNVDRPGTGAPAGLPF